jgi:hypothetical protein
LQPFIYAELLGKTLFERLAVKPELIVVSQPQLLDLRREIPVPVGCIVTPETAQELADVTRQRIGQQTVSCHRDFGDDLTEWERAARLIASESDLAEPLDRVRDALFETVRAGAVA